MYLKSISGSVIFEGYFHTIKRAVEAAVRERVCLDGVDLRYANLSQAELDGAQMSGASLWGSNLTGANLTGVNLTGADCRNTNFKDCCLVDASMLGADFRGSYFSCTLFYGADIRRTKFSCPSIFQSKLHEAKSLQGAIYSHQGEFDCDLSRAPIVIQGTPKPVVILKNDIIIGDNIHGTNHNFQ